jgi:hypothetical protein
MGDAAVALQAGLAELLPKMGTGHHGVLFSDGSDGGEAARADRGGPVRKLRRWLASR